MASADIALAAMIVAGKFGHLAFLAFVGTFRPVVHPNDVERHEASQLLDLRGI